MFLLDIHKYTSKKKYTILKGIRNTITWLQILQILNISVDAPKELFLQCTDGTLLVVYKWNSSRSTRQNSSIFQQCTDELYQQSTEGLSNTLQKILCRKRFGIRKGNSVGSISEFRIPVRIVYFFLLGILVNIKYKAKLW